MYRWYTCIDVHTRSRERCIGCTGPRTGSSLKLSPSLCRKSFSSHRVARWATPDPGNCSANTRHPGTRASSPLLSPLRVQQGIFAEKNFLYIFRVFIIVPLFFLSILFVVHFSIFFHPTLLCSCFFFCFCRIKNSYWHSVKTELNFISFKVINNVVRI